jgi:hypothetical protein
MSTGERALRARSWTGLTSGSGDLAGHDCTEEAEFMTIIDDEASVESTSSMEWCGDEAAPEQQNLRRRLLFGDVAAATMAWGGALWIAERPANSLAVELMLLAGAVVATYLALVWQQLYRARVASNRSDEIARIARAVFAVSVAGVLGDHLLGLPIFTPAGSGSGCGVLERPGSVSAPCSSWAGPPSRPR